jgi:hypothetical protein
VSIKLTSNAGRNLATRGTLPLGLGRVNVFNMKFVLITKDPEVEASAREGFTPYECASYADWQRALDESGGADMIFVDLLATLQEPNKIAGYEAFAEAKMKHPVASTIPLVLISPPADYELDFMAGWPDFIVANIPRPISAKVFRRASTWT